MTTSGWIICSHVSQRVVYLVLLCLAIYLIYIGDIVQKFCRKRSNFAEYSEEISELPVVQLSLEYRTPSDILNYGKDFLVTYQGNDSVKNLTIGENIVEGVKMDLEERFERSDNTTIYFTYQSLFLRPRGFKSKFLLRLHSPSLNGFFFLFYLFLTLGGSLDVNYLLIIFSDMSVIFNSPPGLITAHLIVHSACSNFCR